MANRSRDALAAQLNPFELLNRATGDAPEVIEREVLVTDPNALIPQGEGVYVYKRFTMTPTGMMIPDDVTPDELLDVGKVVKGLESSIQWIVGDLMNAIEYRWGEGYQAVAEALGYEVKTVYEWAHVCRKVSIRMETLSFGHHQLVAGKTPDEQLHWLEQARDGRWTIAELRKMMAGKTRPALPKPTGKEKLVRAAIAYVDNERGNVPHMKPQQREDFAQRCQTIAEHYVRLAQWAMGEGE